MKQVIAIGVVLVAISCGQEEPSLWGFGSGGKGEEAAKEARIFVEVKEVDATWDPPTKMPARYVWVKLSNGKAQQTQQTNENGKAVFAVKPGQYEVSIDHCCPGSDDSRFQPEQWPKLSEKDKQLISVCEQRYKEGQLIRLVSTTNTTNANAEFELDNLHFLRQTDSRTCLSP